MYQDRRPSTGRTVSGSMRPRSQLLGHGPRNVPPTWRGAPQSQPPTPRDEQSGFLKLAPETGSKAYVSHLPADVTENELAELFQETVGPVSDVFMVYNNAGRTKGIAVVTFVRAEHAALARQKYNHKIIDQRRPIRIELIVDPRDDESTPDTPKSTSSLNGRVPTGPASLGNVRSPPPGPGLRSPQPQAQAQRSLLARLGPPTGNASRPPASVPSLADRIAPRGPARAKPVAEAPRARPQAHPQAALPQRLGPGRARRLSKRRITLKNVHKTVHQLDQEMDAYNASTSQVNGTGNV